jgi:hypothetical protein
MNRCPDWTALAAARLTAMTESERGENGTALTDPPGFAAARAHLAGCPDCRVAALAADPLFLFSTLEPADAAAGETEKPRGAAGRDDHDVREMQSAVFALVRASRVAPDAERELAKDRPVSRWLRYAAGFVIASLLGLSGASRAPREEAAVPPAPESLASWTEATADPATVEELDRPEARVYELSNAELAVVMIVDAGLDV